MNETQRRWLRSDTEAILRAGIAGASPGPLLERALRKRSWRRPVHLLAVGKAAVLMARAAYAQLPVRRALVVAPQLDDLPWPEPRPRLLRSDHPMPGQRSIEAGRAVYEFLEQLMVDDVALVLLSGGGSALLTLPAPGLTLHDLAATTRALLTAGADIHELNCVRRHLDEAKGGRLARLASPGSVICLALSDVPGDDPSTIASGPFSPDPTTFGDALAVLARHDLLPRLPPAVRQHLEEGRDSGRGESLKPGDPALEQVQLEIIGSNRDARVAAAEEARRRGYVARLPERWLDGEARVTGEQLGKALADHRVTAAEVLVFGGETTVTVRGNGVGGRNLELALGAALALDGVERAVLGSVGTDGVDGVSPAAGAIVDGTTVPRLRRLGYDPAAVLAANDCYPALAAAGDALVTGATGTNVMDLVLTLAVPAA